MTLENLYLFLLICCLHIAVLGVSPVRKLTSEDLKNIGESTNQDYIAVFFDKPSIRQGNPKFAKEFDKSSDILESFGIELCKVNCAEESISQCSNKERNIFVYRKGDPIPSEGIDVSHLFDEDSIVANLLQSVLTDQYYFIFDEDSFNRVLAVEQGYKDVVLCYVKGLGIKEHRHFLELVHYFKNEVFFGLTTDEELVKKIGLFTNQKAAVYLFHCKQMKNTQGRCPSTKFTGKVEKTPLIRFVRSQELPKYVILPSNRSTVFDSLQPPVDKLFVFTDKVADLDTKEIEQMALEFQGAIGVILVNVNDQKDMLASFGLAQDSNFPTAAFVAAKGDGDNRTYIELFPENIARFTLNNLKHFIKPLIDNPTAEYNRIAEASSLQKLTYASYKDAMKSLDTNYLFALDFLMVVFCKEDHEPCEKFSRTLRRIEGEKLPVVYLYLTKSEDDFIQYTSELEYEAMMKFITDHTKIKRPVSLPASLSDEALISFPHTNEENEDSEEYIDKLDEEEESESETSQSSEESVDEVYLPEEETEDDEVSEAVLKAKPTVVPETLVPALTDKTFDTVKKENDLLVVDFFQPWDARNLDVGNFAIKLARVNCFDWTDVCQSNNITIYPTIKMYRKDSDEITYRGPLDSDHLAKAGELTPFNLPTYLSYKKPLLIVFRADSEDSVITPVMTRLARDKSLPSIFLCWMPVYSDKDVNAEILKSYAGTSGSLPALVLVNHEKGTVHLFKNEVTKQAVKNWVESILTGKEQPSRLFADGEWKPRLEGYDFLRMIDEEEEEKERQRLKKKKVERALKEKDDIDEEEPNWSPPEANEVEKRDRKPNRLRRPELGITRRDEL
ncbi:hypothetical protein pdam_00023158 [Pocillopora damicornis]|uniref:Thioredoxin domain-containing protein n=1 Tax=Pocillopora damicornis TaxID=46731 RepID=A0A3M6US65_POCDA|nr:hypothetical protein pdam_00023158 [Pocillopora damicornis]